MTGSEIGQFIRLYDACYPLHRLSRDTRYAFQLYLGEFESSHVRAGFDSLINEGRQFPPTVSEIRARVLRLFIEIPEYLRPELPEVGELSDEEAGALRELNRQKMQTMIHSLSGSDRDSP